MKINLVPKILLYWYIFIFFSTETLSHLHLLERGYILLGEMFFWSILLFSYRKEILQALQNINFRSKSLLFILTLFIITFIQGFFSAPSTTDSMVYHLPRIMYWMQEKTLYQDVIRNPHDFMAPFAEYILLHLYFITGSDRLLFFSQWIAYVVLVIVSRDIAERLGANKGIRIMTSLFVATLPIAVMQASSTQVDMIVAVLIAVITYLVLILVKKMTTKNSVLLALALGLGISTKATFYPFIIIPLGLMFLLLIKKRLKEFLVIILAGLISLTLPMRFMSQNLGLYGHILGPLKEGGGLELTNDSFNLATVISNIIRNIMIHIPIPFFATQVQSFLEFVHKLIGVSISAPETTCCDFQFHVLPILYPQEDIVGNPLHLLLILIAVVLVFKKKVVKNKELVSVFILTLLSLVAFSAILKWQPFHSRLQISFFVIGTISSVLILSKFKKGLYVLKTFLILSMPLAVLLVLLNVSRPFISYNLFYNQVKSFTTSLNSIPGSFLIKPRAEQYFNARYYWYLPYKGITEILTDQKFTKNDTIFFDLPDGFEYPLWVLIKNQNPDLRVIPKEKILPETIIISTSQNPYKREGYITECLKTGIDYGYACLSISNK